MNIVELFNGLRLRNHASLAHSDVIEHLTALGFQCQSEYWVADRGDGRRGRIDIIAHNDHMNMAIEVDNVSARKKSFVKLSSMEGYIKFILLRNGKRWYRQVGVYVLSIPLRYITPKHSE